eukprot:gene10772-11925_t
MAFRNLVVSIIIFGFICYLEVYASLEGSVGVLHLIEKPADIDWLINKGKHKPYIPLISSEMFSLGTMNKLVASKKVNGALVINAGSLGKTPVKGFSPDPSCPLDQYGSYSTDKDYSDCKKMKWNKQGNSQSMLYYDLPIFALSSEQEVNDTIACIKKHNMPSKGDLKLSYPLCAVELKDFMFAAKDTPTCMRRSSLFFSNNVFCDPLGDWNVWGTLYPLMRPLMEKEVILISTRMDSSSFFHDLAPGANNDVSGIVTLLAVASALGNLKRNMNNGVVAGSEMKPIMFVLFNGEIWDYIGSSRMVWDMENGDFPYLKARNTSDGKNVIKMDLSSVGHFIDISQVGQMDKETLWVHSDPVSTGKDASVKSEVDKIMSYLSTSGQSANISVKNASTNLPLPPASFQRFLRTKQTKKIPGVVLADHETEFQNKYYNSRFDNAENIGLKFDLVNKDGQTYLSTNKDKAEEFAKVAETIATAVYKLATDGKEPAVPLTVSPRLTANLLSCFLISASCPGFREILPVNAPDTLPQKPYSRYISVASLTNPITDVIFSLLSYYTGNWTTYNTSTCKTTKRTSGDKTSLAAVSTIAVKGPINQSSVCVHAAVYMTDAVSPAFQIKDYASKEYSTWAESMWTSDFGVRMFLIDGPTVEYLAFFLGALMVILSFLVVYFVSKNAEVIFTPDVASPTPEPIQDPIN